MKPLLDHSGTAIVDVICAIGLLKEAVAYITEAKDDGVKEAEYELAAFYRDRQDIVMKVIEELENHLYAKSEKS